MGAALSEVTGEGKTTKECRHFISGLENDNEVAARCRGFSLWMTPFRVAFMGGFDPYATSGICRHA